MSDGEGVIPGSEGAEGGSGVPGGDGVRDGEVIPVFLYHAVMDEPPDWIAEFTVTPKLFGEHLDAVVDSGRTPITISALAEFLAGRAQLPPRPVLLTFDDGFADLPGPTADAVFSRGLTATAYLTTGAITPGERSLLPPAPMMSLGGAVELERAGMEIGSHTVTHAQLDTLAPRALAHELRHSRAVLEDTLEHQVRHLAYPHGYNDRRVRRMAVAAGYETATAVRHALSSERDETHRIARLIVRRSHTVGDVGDWLSGRGARIAPYRDAPRTVAWRWYRKGRAAVRGPVFAG